MPEQTDHISTSDSTAQSAAAVLAHLNGGDVGGRAGELTPAQVQASFTKARAAQAQWASVGVEGRLEVISNFRQLLVDRHAQAAATVTGPHRRSTAETLAAEIMPLCDAAAFLEKRACKILKTKKLGASGRPAWLWGVNSEIRREPIGLVLIIGPFNYPLLLTGVPLLQALVAGNAVVIKPGRWGFEAADFLQQTLQDAGLPAGLVVVMDESIQAVQQAIDLGIDKVVFTGSALAGRQVLEMLAPSGTPSVMELSGADPMIVLPGADLDRVVRGIDFGLSFNTSATCIAPRRLIVHRSLMQPLEARLKAVIAQAPAGWVDPRVSARLARFVDAARSDGARVVIGDSTRPLGGSVLLVIEPARTSPILQADLFAPVTTMISFVTTDEAVSLANDCPYGLGASIFGPEKEARRVASKVSAGSVVINDIIAPTADPRLAFTGRKASGFGATRGEEGLLEMTLIKNVSVRKRGMLAHLQPTQPGDDERLAWLLRLTHRPGLFEKLSALVGLIKADRKAKASAAKQNAESVMEPAARSASSNVQTDAEISAKKPAENGRK